MATEWFYQSSGRQSPPVDSRELRRLAEAGIVRPDTLIRQGASGRWVRAEHVRGLFQPSTPAPSPSLGACLPGPPPPPAPVPECGAPNRGVSGESPTPFFVGTSGMATMTISEAYYVVHDIVAPALLATRGGHARKPVSLLKGYDLVQICTAFNLLIANEFLLSAICGASGVSGAETEKMFAESVKLYRVPLAALCLFVADDQVDVITAKRALVDFDDPLLFSQETASSFAEYCKSVGADDPMYWQKIYTRAGLEYTMTSPRGNRLMGETSGPTILRRVAGWLRTTGQLLRKTAKSLWGLLLLVAVLGGVLLLQRSGRDIGPWPDNSNIFQKYEQMSGEELASKWKPPAADELVHESEIHDPHSWLRQRSARQWCSKNPDNLSNTITAFLAQFPNEPWTHEREWEYRAFLAAGAFYQLAERLRAKSPPQGFFNFCCPRVDA